MSVSGVQIKQSHTLTLSLVAFVVCICGINYSLSELKAQYKRLTHFGSYCQKAQTLTIAAISPLSLSLAHSTSLH